MDWTNDKIINFIQAIETYPVLWDSSHSDYKNKNKKHDATQELAQSFNCDSTEVMRKWKIILAQYRREKKKIADSKSSGSGILDIYKPKWFAYAYLNFFHGRDEPNVSLNSHDEINEQVEAGDVLLNVNGTDVNRFTTKEVLKCLRLSTDPVTLRLKRDPQIKAHLRRYLSTAADRNLPVAHNHNANTSPNLNSNSSSLSSGSASGPSWRSSQSSPTATDSSSPPSRRSRQSAASAGSGEALLGGTEDDVWQPHRIPPKQPKFEAYMMTGELMLNLSSAERSSELQAYQNSYQSHSLQGHHPHHHHHAPRHRHAQRYNSTPASPNESRLPNNTVREVQRYNSTPATTALGTSRRGSDSSDREQQGYAFNSTPASPASENNVSPSHLPHSSQNGQHCQVGNRVPPQACVRTSRSEDHLQKEWSLSTVAVDMDEDVTSSLNTLLDTREPADIATNMPTNTSRIAPSPPGSTREHLSHTGPNSPSETGPERIVWTYNAPVSSASERITSHYNGSSSTTATSNSTSISDGISPQRSMSPASPTSMSSSVMSSASVSRRTPPPAALSDSRNITNVGVGTDTQRNSIVSQHHRFNGDASVSEAMSSVSSPDYQDLLERSELLDERNRMQLSDASDSDSTILASEPAHQHRIVIQVKGASAGGDGCGSLETHVNGSGVMKVLQNGNGNMDNTANTPEAHGYQELKSDDILNTILIDSVSDEGSDVDSLHSFHYSPKAVDIPSAVRLAKRLYHLDGFKKSDVSRHLSKNNDFAKAVAEEYVRHFDFQKQGLDSALRLFLARFALTGETQERERVLVHFSRRYLDCNPGSFSSQDAVHTLTCAIMLLNTDLHGLGAGNGAASGPAFRRMSCAEFIDNLTGLNDGGDFPKDVLKRLYHAIKNKPLQWAIDGEGGSDNEEAKAGVSMSNNGGTNGNGTSAPPVAQSNPFLDVPDQSRAIEYKKGYVMRKSCKEANGKRTPFGKRSWKMFYCTLRDLVLYLHKDEHGFRKPQMSDDLYNAIRIHHALATKANDYTKKQHVFRLQTADQAEYLFQTSDSKELNSWVDTVNFVCAAFSAQPLAGAVGSQRKFQRPLLPCSHTKLSLRDQLRDHEDRCASLEAELHAIRSSPGMNAPYHKDKEAYLQFELKRYKTYAQCLKWRWSEERGVQPPPLPERPPPRAPEAPAPAP